MTAANVVSGQALIDAERRRQVQTLGYTPAHDRLFNTGGELLAAARVYATPAADRVMHQPRKLVPPTPVGWPWGWIAWKPKTELDDLVRAGALFQAEADRLLSLRRRAAAEVCLEGRERCAEQIDRLTATAGAP